MTPAVQSARGQQAVAVGDIRIGRGHPLVLIAGPCVIEGREMALRTAEAIRKETAAAGMPAIFKASYKKANRTTRDAFRGRGADEALAILAEVRKATGLPVLTDIHTEAEAEQAAEFADVLQIPAFLCRQTELLEAAGRTGKPVNIKKGQFMAPEEMKHAAEKALAGGAPGVMLTERGASFGYHNLVVDMRSLVVMRALGHPVVLDVTHSVQLPAAEGTKSGGQPEYIFPLARAGTAVGIDALFLETHPDPRNALSDAATQLELGLLGPLLKQVSVIDAAARAAAGSA